MRDGRNASADRPRFIPLALGRVFVHAELDADEMRTIVEAIERKLPAGAWPVWTGSNHDAGRLATRWAGGDEARARVALLMLLVGLNLSGVFHLGGSVQNAGSELASRRGLAGAFFTGGGAQAPSPGGRMEGAFSFGQYIRIVSRNSPLGAGSQLATLSSPGDSCWK